MALRYFHSPHNSLDSSKYALSLIKIVFTLAQAADSGLANVIVEDCFQRNTLVVIGGTARTVSNRHQNSKLRNLILVYDSESSVDLAALKASFGDTWNPRARIIVCIDKVEKNKPSEILKYFWKHDLLNVALTVRSLDSGLEETFIYNPFIPEAEMAIKLNPNDSMFPDKLTDLNNRSIPISMYFHFPKAMLTNYTILKRGADVEVLRTLSKKLNFSIDLKTAAVFATSYTVSLPSGERVGMIGDVLVERSDAVMNARSIESTIGRRVEITYPTLQTRYCVVVPKAMVMPMMIRMLSPFPKVIWIALVGVIGLLLVGLALMNEKNKLMKISEICFHYSLVRIPERTFKRIFFISFIWWSYLMACIYQVNFVNELILPKHYKDVDTLEELYESNLPLIVGDSMMKVLNNSELSILRKLAERAIEHLVLEDCKQQLKTSLNVACAADEYVSGLLVKRYNTDDRTPLTNKVKECLSLHWDVYVVKYGFPLLDKFNFYIQSMLEAGLYNKWVEDVAEATGKWMSNEESRSARKLTIKHFEGPFGILLIGCGISLVVFILELIVFRMTELNDQI